MCGLASMLMLLCDSFIVQLEISRRNCPFSAPHACRARPHNNEGARHMAKRILIVEDNEDSRFILVATLRGLGYETIEAETGTKGVEKALTEKPDLIVMDLGLPDITGIDAARGLKNNLITAHIPIIAHSAWSSGQWKEEALKVGMACYLEKPASRELMKATIEKFLRPEESNPGKESETTSEQNKTRALRISHDKGKSSAGHTKGAT